MKNLMKFVAIAVLVFTTLGVSAQQTKIGHIDMQELISAMPETIAAKNQLQKKQEEIQKEFDSMKSQYQKLITDYQAKETTYSDIMKNTKQQEIQSLQSRIQQFSSLAQEELTKAENSLMQPIVEKARKAINDVAKAHGFTYIITNTAILYEGANAVDILPMVKQNLGIK